MFTWESCVWPVMGPVSTRNPIRDCILLWIVSVIVLCNGCSSDAVSSGRAEARAQRETKQEPVETQQLILSDTPRVTLDKTVYDFGEIRPQSKNIAAFRLANAGKSILRITNVQKCCGAVVKLDKNELAPGECAVLTAEYLASPAPQPLSKKIRLFTNDPQNPQIDLIITGKVIQTFVWTPTRFEIAAYADPVACPEITIRGLDGKPFAVKGFTTTGQCLTADYDPGHQATELTLRPKPDLAKLMAAQFSNGRVKIDVDHQDYEAIYLDFEIKPVFEITPQRMFIVNAEPGKALFRTLQLQDRRTTSHGDVSQEIESITFKNGARVEVRGVTNIGKGCEMSLAIWPAAEKEKESLWTDQLLIQMKEGRQVSIPVHVLFKSQPL